MRLDTTPRLADPDALFALLVQAHHGLGAAESRRLDARLVLILANHIGDAAVLREALALARSTGGQPGGLASRPASFGPASSGPASSGL